MEYTSFWPRRQWNLYSKNNILLKNGLLFLARLYIIKDRFGYTNYKKIKVVIIMDKENAVETVAEAEPKKKTGRKAMTPEEKAAAVETRAQNKAKADSLSPVLIMQFQGGEVDLSTLVEAAKADFRESKKRTSVTDLKLYIKPEEHTAYYVVNEKHNGSISF